MMLLPAAFAVWFLAILCHASPRLGSPLGLRAALAIFAVFFATESNVPATSPFVPIDTSALDATFAPTCFDDYELSITADDLVNLESSFEDANSESAITDASFLCHHRDIATMDDCLALDNQAAIFLRSEIEQDSLLSLTVCLIARICTLAEYIEVLVSFNLDNAYSYTSVLKNLSAAITLLYELLIELCLPIYFKAIFNAKYLSKLLLDLKNNAECTARYRWTRVTILHRLDAYALDLRSLASSVELHGTFDLKRVTLPVVGGRYSVPPEIVAQASALFLFACIVMFLELLGMVRTLHLLLRKLAKCCNDIRSMTSVTKASPWCSYTLQQMEPGLTTRIWHAHAGALARVKVLYAALVSCTVNSSASSSSLEQANQTSLPSRTSSARALSSRFWYKGHASYISRILQPGGLVPFVLVLNWAGCRLLDAFASIPSVFVQIGFLWQDLRAEICSLAPCITTIATWCSVYAAPSTIALVRRVLAAICQVPTTVWREYQRYKAERTRSIRAEYLRNRLETPEDRRAKRMAESLRRQARKIQVGAAGGSEPDQQREDPRPSLELKSKLRFSYRLPSRLESRNAYQTDRVYPVSQSKQLYPPLDAFDLARDDSASKVLPNVVSTGHSALSALPPPPPVASSPGVAPSPASTVTSRQGSAPAPLVNTAAFDPCPALLSSAAFPQGSATSHSLAPLPAGGTSALYTPPLAAGATLLGRGAVSSSVYGQASTPMQRSAQSAPPFSPAPLTSLDAFVPRRSGISTPMAPLGNDVLGHRYMHFLAPGAAVSQYQDAMEVDDAGTVDSMDCDAWSLSTYKARGVHMQTLDISNAASVPGLGKDPLWWDIRNAGFDNDLDERQSRTHVPFAFDDDMELYDVDFIVDKSEDALIDEASMNLSNLSISDSACALFEDSEMEDSFVVGNPYPRLTPPNTITDAGVDLAGSSAFYQALTSTPPSSEELSVPRIVVTSAPEDVNTHIDQEATPSVSALSQPSTPALVPSILVEQPPAPLLDPSPPASSSSIPAPAATLLSTPSREEEVHATDAHVEPQSSVPSLTVGSSEHTAVSNSTSFPGDTHPAAPLPCTVPPPVLASDFDPFSSSSKSKSPAEARVSPSSSITRISAPIPVASSSRLTLDSTGAGTSVKLDSRPLSAQELLQQPSAEKSAAERARIAAEHTRVAALDDEIADAAGLSSESTVSDRKGKQPAHKAGSSRAYRQASASSVGPSVAKGATEVSGSRGKQSENLATKMQKYLSSTQRVLRQPQQVVPSRPPRTMEETRNALISAGSQTPVAVSTTPAGMAAGSGIRARMSKSSM